MPIPVRSRRINWRHLFWGISAVVLIIAVADNGHRAILYPSARQISLAIAYALGFAGSIRALWKGHTALDRGTDEYTSQRFYGVFVVGWLLFATVYFGIGAVVHGSAARIAMTAMAAILFAAAVCVLWNTRNGHNPPSEEWMDPI